MHGGKFLVKRISPPDFSTRSFNPMVQKFIVEKSGVEKFMVEKSGVERSRVEKSRVEMSLNLEMNPGDKSDFILKQSENVKQFPVFEL